MLNIRKAVISIIFTFLLGPGAGHLYLGKIKKGLALIAVTCCTGLLFFIDVIKTSPNPAMAAQNAQQLLHDYYASHPSTVLYYDIVFAAVWAYAFVDAFFKSYTDIPPLNDANQT